MKKELGTLAHMECSVNLSHLFRAISANRGQSQLSSSIIDSRLWDSGSTEELSLVHLFFFFFK